MSVSRTRLLPILLFATMLLASCSPEKKTAAPVGAAAPAADSAPPPPVSASQTVLQKTFTVKTSATFPFEIPAHSVRPHLHGIFVSFVRDVHGPSDAAANLDFLILNSDQHADVVANRPSEALFSIEASHHHSVNLDLPPSFDQPVTYYMVFRNASTGPAKFVEADFRVDF
jgi:hypothetical protein